MDAPISCFAIDLGRHYVRVATANQKTGETIILQKFRGNRILIQNNFFLAIFALNEDGLPIIGDLAFNRHVARPNIIADATEDHRFACNVYSKSFCYAQCDDRGQYRISPLDRSDIIQISQQQVIAAFLAKAKSIVVQKYNCTDFDKIIVVPTFASDNYRRVVLQAAQIANYGIKVQLLDQMSAVAISYKYKVAKRIQTTDPDISDHLVAIASVGARSAEFALFLESPWTCQLELVKCAGQAILGSEDLSETLASYLLEEDSLKNCGNPNIPGSIFEKCERAKQNVSMPIQRTSIEFAFMDRQQGKQNKFRFGLKRKDFDQICESTFLGIQELIEKAFGGFHKKRIDRLFCAGDGCKNLRIHELLEVMMASGYKDLSPNSLEDVAINGAAIYAAILAKKCAGLSSQQIMTHKFEQFYTPQQVYRCIELQQVYKDKEQNAQWKSILFVPNEKRPTNWHEFSYEGNQKITIRDHAGIVMGTMNSEQLEPYSGIKFRLDASGCLEIGFFFGQEEIPCSAEILLFNRNLFTKNQIDEHNLEFTANSPFVAFQPIITISPSKAHDQNIGISTEINQGNNVDKKEEMMNDGSNKLDLMEGTSSSTKIANNSEDVQIQMEKNVAPSLPENTQKTHNSKVEEEKKRALKNDCNKMMENLESLVSPSKIPPFSLNNIRALHSVLMEMCSNSECPYDLILPFFDKYQQLAECFACKHAAVDLAKKAKKIVSENRSSLLFACAFPSNFNVDDLYKKFLTDIEKQEKKKAILDIYGQFKYEILLNMDPKKKFSDRNMLLIHLNANFPDIFSTYPKWEHAS